MRILIVEDEMRPVTGFLDWKIDVVVTTNLSGKTVSQTTYFTVQ